MPKQVKLIPAYGRRVENLEELQDMWLSGKDFQMFCYGIGGGYCSIRDYAIIRKDFDIITLRGSNQAASAVFEKTIFTHLLAGNTSYI